jgi:hypothetical protein
MNFIYIRRVGYGVREAKEFLEAVKKPWRGYGKAPEAKEGIQDTKVLLMQILETLSQELEDKC